MVSGSILVLKIGGGLNTRGFLENMDNRFIKIENNSQFKFSAEKFE